MGITSSDEKPTLLVPILRLDERTIHNPNRSHKPYLLEIPTKPE